MSKYIDAEVMINALRELRTKHLIQSVFGEDMRDNAVTAGTLEAVAQILDGLPAADVQEVRRGRWEEHLINNIYCEGGVAIRLTCPVCGECFTVTREARPRERFCRWCGAKMDEVNKCENCEVAKYHNLEDDDTPCQNCGEDEDASETL